MNRVKAFVTTLLVTLGLVFGVNMTSALATAPSVWYYGDHNTACHEVETAVGSAGNCVWSSRWPDFILESSNGAIGTDRLAYRAVDKGNLVGGRVGYPGYWMQSNTANLAGSHMVLQRDCNIVIKNSAGAVKWTAGSYVSGHRDCRIDMTSYEVFYVDYKDSVGNWVTICSVPQGWPNGSNCPGYQGNM